MFERMLINTIAGTGIADICIAGTYSSSRLWDGVTQTTQSAMIRPAMNTTSSEHA